MIRSFLILAALACAQTALACDPPAQGAYAQQRMQARVMYSHGPAPTMSMYAQPMYGAQYRAAPMGYGAAVNVNVQRGIMPRNRGVQVGVASGGAAVNVSMGRGVFGGRASAAACST